ncbi:MAG TPA: hypothetical protein VFQ61_20090 [Polyangiaceae bacterium]|nr:hypothetical protein [Polyangiaceae bacterium]
MEALASLSKADGVLGVVIFDEDGTCLSNQLPSPYEPILMFEIVKRLSVGFDAFSSLDPSPIASFSVECEDGSLLLRRLEKHWVVALTHPDANMSMINVALNVVVLNLNRGFPGSGKQPVSRSSTDSMLGHSSTSISLSHGGQDLEIPPDAVDRSFVQQLLVIYTDYLGPAARAVFKQQLAALGVTSRTLRRAQVNDLIARLVTKIPVAQRQKEFTAAARKHQDKLPP